MAQPLVPQSTILQAIGNLGRTREHLIANGRDANTINHIYASFVRSFANPDENSFRPSAIHVLAGMTNDLDLDQAEESRENAFISRLDSFRLN